MLLLRCSIVIIVAACCFAVDSKTALDRYVAASDPSYKYELVNTVPGEGFTAYVLEMTSQQWRRATEVDRQEWKHWVTVIKPETVKSDTGFLFITGGANNGKPPASPDSNLRTLAVETGTVVTELRMVPNQPIIFAGETKGRVEDSLIAYTWDKYLRGGDESWPARLPMTKSAVRAMDTVTSFCAGQKIKVDKFVVAGASKRGWTTWATAAVDKRVVAIVPLVIDLLNIEPSFQHHWRAYGFWAPSVGDYVQAGIMDWNGTKQYRALMKIEEPYEYRERLTMPKLMINATGDQFFLPDSSQFYFDDLKGEKHLRYVPNADHSLRKSDAFDTLIAFYDAFVNQKERPKLSWKMAKDGSVRVKTDFQPIAVKLWQATNPEARDFRLEKIGAAWKESAVAEESKGQYLAKVEKPEKGYTAYFMELTYPGTGKYPLKLTTAVRVTPTPTFPCVSTEANQAGSVIATAQSIRPRRGRNLASTRRRCR
ncbi:MAG: PhoPQ-activated pathogenicity-related family protein [Bryobacteraceae bacterium]